MAEQLDLDLLRTQLLNRYVPSSVIYGNRSISSFAQIMSTRIPGRLWELLADPKPAQEETTTKNTAALAESIDEGEAEV